MNAPANSRTAARWGSYSRSLKPVHSQDREALDRIRPSARSNIGGPINVAALAKIAGRSPPLLSRRRVGFEREADARRFWEAMRKRLEEFLLYEPSASSRAIPAVLAGTDRASANLTMIISPVASC